MGSPRASEEIRLSVPWGFIAGKTWGNSSGNRVLVVHGTLDNAGSFERIMPLLPDGFYYVAIDLPGHGLSSAYPQGIQLDYFNYILVIRIVLDELKWDNCIYIGHSFGAQLGLFTSILYPNRITNIACLDGFLPPPIEGKDLLTAIRSFHENTLSANKRTSPPPLYTKEEVLHALQTKRNFPLNSKAAEALFVRGTTKVGELYKYNRDIRLRRYLNPMLGSHEYSRFLKKIKIPVLVVIAAWSWIDSAFDDEMIAMFRRSMGENYKIVRVNGNHDVHNNNPEIVAPFLCEFLSASIKSKL